MARDRYTIFRQLRTPERRIATGADGLGLLIAFIRPLQLDGIAAHRETPARTFRESNEAVLGQDLAFEEGCVKCYGCGYSQC